MWVLDCGVDICAMQLFEELDTALGDVFNKGKPLYLPNKGRLLRLIFLTETAEQVSLEDVVSKSDNSLRCEYCAHLCFEC